MPTTERRAHRARRLLLWFPVLGVMLLSLACTSGDLGSEEGSETHFLMPCKPGDCGDGFVCRCGVCTRVCTDTTDCSVLGVEATCAALAPRVAEQRCTSAPEPGYCDVPCLLDDDCSVFDGPQRCERGFCRAATGTSNPPDVPECEAPDIVGDELIVLGDACLELSGFVDELERVARENGALSPGEEYRSYASAATSFLTQGPFSIATQYEASRERAARVVIMNGGATDMLSEPCEGGISAECPEVQAAVAGAERLFRTMAADGVEHLVYVFYPNPRANLALQTRLDTLRPLLENACGRSSVACHWMDLRVPFDGHDDHYAATDPAGIVFSTAGARSAALEVWEIMSSRCVPR